MNVIYARQSIDKKDSLSIEAQIEQCRKFAGDDAKVYKDKGYSGKNIKRPDFTELIKAVESGAVKKIFVYRLDRFSRSVADFSRMWELLERHGVEFYSATENFDTSTPIGRAMLNIVLVFAQLERETTAERVKDNYIHRFKLGAWGGGPAPYGFDLAKIISGSTKASSLTANNCADTVKTIFEEYAKPDSSLRGVANALTQKGIHGPKREAWDNVTVSRILHSPVYVKADSDVYWFYLAKGLQITQGIEAFDGEHACNVIGRRDRTKNKYNSLSGQMLSVSNHKGFIDSGLWLKVQAKLNGNPQISQANAGKYSWLTGLMKCAKCGYAIKVNSFKKENRLRLVCSGKSNMSVCDASISVGLRELEDYIANEIEKALKAAPPCGALPCEKKQSDDILATEQKIGRLVSALANSGDISAAYITREIERLHRILEQLLSSPQKTETELAMLDFKSLDFEEKKIVAAEFINRILINGNEVNIEWKM